MKKILEENLLFVLYSKNALYICHSFLIVCLFFFLHQVTSCGAGFFIFDRILNENNRSVIYGFHFRKKHTPNGVLPLPLLHKFSHSMFT